ncbi:TetR/AcrR family transcriptional regulator [Leifsonia sp. EB34]|uniref:TetR/AcrR family transcriptional regulator n=1 Tax=Leifsonia sp. EB34 TaxID=3156303 RepID=UPI0035110B8D
MATAPTARPGGRSARIQLAVHSAVTELLEENGGDRTALSIPEIAKRAGVNTSTIYRRWRDLQGLLAAVASNSLALEQVEDTGTLEGDLLAWFVPYVEEFSTELGRQVLRDMVADKDVTTDYFEILRRHIEEIRSRAIERGEAPPATERVVDVVVAPVIYRILFTHADEEQLDVRDKIDRLIGEIADSGE